MRVAVITPAIQDPHRLFGAERHFVGMVEAFRNKVDTDWIQVPVSEASWNGVLQSYLDCFDLDLSRYDLVVSTKNPTFMVQHPNHICWLLHQIRVFYDRFDEEYGHLPGPALAEKRQQREIIHQLDRLAFQRVRKIFTNGSETARRLKHYSGFDAEILYPPVLATGHYCAGQDYFFLPGRLHQWKRVDLAVRAMQHISDDIPLLIAGTGEDEDRLRELAGGDPRIHFLGFVNDAEMLALYANALAVLFVPKDEDFGYITVEAMLSHKPVIVCTDSGQPARLIQNGRSGFVVNPDPTEIAGAMSLLAGDRELARNMGEAAHESAPPQSWDAVIERLLEAGTGDTKPAVSSGGRTWSPSLEHEPIRGIQILVADNQVLEPAVGGARVRVKEICNGLARYFPTEYIGAFDWPGPASTDHTTPSGWRCRVFALSDLHYRLSQRLQRWVSGGSVIDVSFSLLAHTSRQFLRALREAVRQADVVVFTHPWCYPLAKRLLRGKYVIYDAHNFEWGLRRELLSGTTIGRLLARYVKRVEGKVARRSNAVWACSTQDADQISEAHGVPLERIFIVPNSADVQAVTPATEDVRRRAKEHFGWGQHPVAIFVGSGYGPNTEAAAFIIETLAREMPDLIFAILGSVREDHLRSANQNFVLPENVFLPGTMEETDLLTALHASDVALNPVVMGSGTNLKMLQFMAAGLATVSTPAGIRGISEAERFSMVTERDRFADNIRHLLSNSQFRLAMGRSARQEAVTNYDWSVVVGRAAQHIHQELKYHKPMDPPFFSVVIPTYNRPENLLRLLDSLMKQTFPDFEVVVVDQGTPPVEIRADQRQRLRIHSLYSSERGMSISRNKGWKHASGTVVAFTDDDCIPEPDWLFKAAQCFDAGAIAGLEGRIRSTNLGDPRYRTVSNVGFEGIGFMTANMFYLRSVLEKIGGFDERFSVFREDTDLAWRAMAFGDIPHRNDVVVFHPPHPVDLVRESRAERAKLFSLDPLLLEKHPQRYVYLICREAHYRNTPGYWSNFLRGMREYQVELPIPMLFGKLSAADPDWWSAVMSGTCAGKFGLNEDDLTALYLLLEQTSQHT